MAKAPNLKQLIGLANSVVETRNYIPVLGTGLLRRIGDGQATYSTTDMDLRVTVTLQMDVDRDTLAQPKTLAVAVGTVTGHSAKIRDGVFVHGVNPVAHVQAPDVNPKDMPGDALLAITGKTAKTIYPGQVLAASLTFVQPAVSTEATRYYLNGVFMHIHKAGMRVVATDGHRLHLDTLPPVKADLKHAAGVIIPAKTVAVVLRALKLYPDAPCELEWTDERVAVRVGAVLVESKTIDGTFPDYERVIPELDCEATVINVPASGRAAFRTAFKLARARKEQRVVGCALHATRGALFPQWRQDGDGVVAYCNGSYLADLLADLNAVVHVTQHTDPMNIRYPDHPDRLAVLMPIRGGTESLPSNPSAEAA